MSEQVTEGEGASRLASPIEASRDVDEVLDAPTDESVTGSLDSGESPVIEDEATDVGRAEAGLDQMIFVLQAGRNTHDQVMRSIELIGEKVIPRFATSAAAAE